MICTNCGTNNIDGAKFCSRCGSRLISAPPAEAPISTFNEPIDARKMSTGKAGLTVALIIACIVIVIQLIVIFILISSPAQETPKMVIEEPEMSPSGRGTIEPARELPRVPAPITADTPDSATQTQQAPVPAEETVADPDTLSF